MSTDGFGTVKSFEEVEEFFKNLGIEYRFSCYHEKNAEGCDLLGDFLTQIKQDHERAAKVYRENCDKNKNGRSCAKYGTSAFRGRGLDQNYKIATEYFGRACEYGDGEGCYYSGQARSGSDEKVTPHIQEYININKALEHLEKGCDLNSGDSCFHASSLYIFGNYGCAKDLKKAFQLSVKGCELNNIECCSNLSFMYMNGQGTEQNIQMGTKIRKKVTSTMDELKKYKVFEFQRTS